MDYEVELVDLQEQRTAVVRGHATLDGIADFLGGAFGVVSRALDEHATGPAGPPFAQYATATDGFDVEAGFPVGGRVGGLADGPVEGTVEGAADGVVAGELPGGRAARTLHRGSYAGVAAAYDALGGWLTENGYRPAGAPWESYLDGPDVDEPRTIVYLPCVAIRRG